MAIYSSRDILTNFSGDLQVSTNGDIKLGTSYETVRSAINFLARTDKGEYIPDNRLGCDLGTKIGENITQSLLLDIEDSTRENLTRFVVDRPDLEVHAVPLNHEEIGMFIITQGTYLNENGNKLDITPEVITYIFPYYGGEPKPVI